MTEYPYVWQWLSRPPGRMGQRCRMVVRSAQFPPPPVRAAFAGDRPKSGSGNSALIRFEDRAEYVTSRNGLRRAE